MSIRIDQLAGEIAKELNSYCDATLAVVERASARVAKETVQTIRDNVNKAGIGGTGEYAASWAQKKDPNSSGRWSSGRVVFSRQPGLPHLLEHGHAKVSGGRVEGRPHIASAAEAAEGKLLAYIKQGIEEGSE